jgi:hypothetical protein
MTVTCLTRPGENVAPDYAATAAEDVDGASPRSIDVHRTAEARLGSHNANVLPDISPPLIDPASTKAVSSPCEFSAATLGIPDVLAESVATCITFAILPVEDTPLRRDVNLLVPRPALRAAAAAIDHLILVDD